MQQLSLFGGDGPLGQMVADLGLLKTSKSMWAGNIGAMVGDLTDIFGSMNLAYELEDLPLLTGPVSAVVDVESTKEAFLEFQRNLGAQLNRVFKDHLPGATVEVASGELFGNGPGLPTAVELHNILLRGGALDESPPNFKQISRIGWAPFLSFFQEWEQIIGSQIDDFRRSLVPTFRQFGTKGLRFERLEASLHEAIEYRQSLLFQRIPARLEVLFQGGFKPAMEALSPEEARDAIESWFSVDAWLDKFMLLVYRTLNAISQFRLERLSALVEAACHFEVG